MTRIVSLRSRRSTLWKATMKSSLLTSTRNLTRVRGRYWNSFICSRQTCKLAHSILSRSAKETTKTSRCLTLRRMMWLRSSSRIARSDPLCSLKHSLGRRQSFLTHSRWWHYWREKTLTHRLKKQWLTLCSPNFSTLRRRSKRQLRVIITPLHPPLIWSSTSIGISLLAISSYR